MFLFAVKQSAKAQPPQRTTTGARPAPRAPRPPRRWGKWGASLLCAGEVEPWLTTQWQTENEHILLAGYGHTFLTKFLKIYCALVPIS